MSENARRLPYNIPDDPQEYADALRRRAAWLRRKFGAGVRATSAIHDVLLRVLQRRAAGEDMPSRGFWRAVIRKVFDQFRRNRRHERFVAERRAALLAAGVRHAATSPCEEDVTAREVQGVIDRVIDALPAAERDLWERHRRDDSHQQIADATGRTVAAVKQAVYRIRLRIQNALPEEYRELAHD